jgi:hypothetical protein
LSSFVTRTWKWADQNYLQLCDQTCKRSEEMQRAFGFHSGCFQKTTTNWPMFSDILFVSLENRSRKINLLTIFWWSFIIMGESANISACFAAWTTLGLEFSLCRFLSQSVCVCASVLWFLCTWPPWAISLHSSTKQTENQTRHRNISQEFFFLEILTEETFSWAFLLEDLDRRNIPKSFSSWRSWQKKHVQEFFFLKILTEETIPKNFSYWRSWQKHSQEFCSWKYWQKHSLEFSLKESNQNFGIFPMSCSIREREEIG